MGYRIGIDVGGTFTDLVYAGPSGGIGVVKTPTTPEKQSAGVLAGLGRIAARENIDICSLLGSTELIVHGTTVATNTMLEFNGAKTGLITTRGFRDDIEIRRGYKERIFDPHYPPPVPIARRRHRLTVQERIDRDGTVLEPLDESEVALAVRRLRDAGVDSVAVCLYFGFLNPVHEKRIAEIVKREHPDAFLSLAHEVLPQIREFERVSTTLVNAYTAPRLSRYLEHLESELARLGFRGEFLVMLSNGGVMHAGYCGKYAVHSLLSGPAGGVVACAQLIAERAGEPDIITVDMGGTSYDVCLIRRGKPSLGTNCWFNRYRVAVPMLDIHTIGAGGGSIAWVDPGGALQVGPRSAGADPGPACYGRGGEEPTVTDANLLLGFLDPTTFLGGEMALDRDAAERAVEAKVARILGIDTIRAARGIFRIVNNSMSNGIRAVSVRRGHDPRDFVLVAFGGNGAVHAGVQARELGIRKLIVPRLATAFSAHGMLHSDIILGKMRTYVARSDQVDVLAVNALLAAMRREVEADLSTAGRRTSEAGDKMQIRCSVDMHYKGETHEITVPLNSEDGVVEAGDLTKAVRDFHAAHESLHTFCNPEDPVFLMNLRLEAIVPIRRPAAARLTCADVDPVAALRGTRPVCHDATGEFRETPIYDGSRLHCGNVMAGPCIIEEPATTVVVYAGQTARLTELDYYEIEIG